ncbi:DUF418 domain-containing protein [Asticcacaulis solisilvae]|uniref:DUF418 domain-containing protein n=1 Tax=Asticcacaulis solisilvae TaxID=1217274 RepID=UPI003FD82286
MTQPAVRFTERMEVVDVLRGYAIMGLFMAHAVEFFGLYWSHPTPSVVHDVVFGLFEGKSFSLLALCFGLSFFIIMDRASRRGIDFSARFVWRLFILFAFGWLYGLIYNGEVLQLLAPLGLILVPLDRIRNNTILAVCGVVCLLQPQMLWRSFQASQGAEWANRPPHYYTAGHNDVYIHGTFLEMIRLNMFEGQKVKWWYYIESGRMMQIVGLYMVGLVLGRIGFFARPEAFTTARRITLAIAAIVGLTLHFAHPALTGLIPHQPNQYAAPGVFGDVLDSLVNLSQMVFAVMLMVELYLGIGRPVLRLLAPAGRMTLTLYIMQGVVFVPLYYGFGLGWHAKLTQIQALGLGIAFFAVQLVFAHLWFRVFVYGPLEWIWRAATYLTVKVPFLRRAETPA